MRFGDKVGGKLLVRVLPSDVGYRRKLNVPIQQSNTPSLILN